MSTAVSLLLCAAAAALLLLSGSGLCVFRLLTGIPCPGCGMTRAVLSLLRGDVSAAAAWHPLVFLLPLFAFLLLRNVFPRLFPFSGSARYLKWETVLCVLLTVLVFAVYVLRLLNGWRG